MPKPNVNDDGHRRPDHHAARQHRSVACRPTTCTSPPTSAPPSRRAGGSSPSTTAWAATRLTSARSSVLDGPADVSGRGQDQSAAGAHQRRRARQSRMAEGLPGQSGAQHHGHQSRRRAQLPAGAHADVLLLRRRDSLAGALLRGHVASGRSRSFRRSSSRSPPPKTAWRAICSPAQPRLA